MEDKHLDKIIREKLERLDVPYQANTWDALAKRMDAEAEETAQAEQEFDETIRQKLYAFETNFQQGHWMALAKQLEAAAIRRQLYRYKATELLLLLLTLFTLGQLLPSDAALHQSTKPIAVVQHTDSVESSTVKKQPELAKIAAVNTLSSESSDEVVVDDEAQKQLKSKDTSSSKTEEFILEVLPLPMMVEDDEREEETAFEAIEIFERTTEKIITPLNTPILLLQKSIIAAALPCISTQEAPIVAERNSSSNQQEQGLVKLDDRALALLDATTQKLIPPTLVPRQNYEFRLGFSTSMSLDQFVTPTNSAWMIEEEEKNWAIGYGSSLTFAWKHHRTEIETGLGYANKSYAPKPNFIIHGEFETGYLMENIERINFTNFELPIQIKYDVVDKARWNVYAMAGTSLQVVREYLTEVKKINLSGLSSASASPLITDNSQASQELQDQFSDESVLSNNQPQPSDVEDRSFSGGWNLETGNFNQNSYVSINGGIGLEFKASETCSFIMQSVIKYNPSKLDGVGPNFDRIHSSTLTLGIKASL